MTINDYTREAEDVRNGDSAKTDGHEEIADLVITYAVAANCHSYFSDNSMKDASKYYSESELLSILQNICFKPSTFNFWVLDKEALRNFKAVNRQKWDTQM